MTLKRYWAPATDTADHVTRTGGIDALRSAVANSYDAGEPDHRMNPRPLMRRLSVRVLRGAKPLVIVAAVVLLWQFVIHTYGLFNIPVKYLGSPSGIWSAFLYLLHHGYNNKSIWYNIGISVARVLAGYLIGLVIALPLGLVLGYYRSIGGWFTPILSFLRPIPALAFVPVAVIWLGIGEGGKILVIAMTSLLYISLSVANAVGTVPEEYLRAGQNYKVPGYVTLLRIILPSASPTIVIGMRTAMALSWAVVVAAELIAAQHGLGYIIENASTFFEINIVYVGIIFIGIIGILMDLFFQYLTNHYLSWVGK